MKKKRIHRKLTVSKNTVSHLQKNHIKGGLPFTHPEACTWTRRLTCVDDTLPHVCPNDPDDVLDPSRDFCSNPCIR